MVGKRRLNKCLRSCSVEGLGADASEALIHEPLNQERIAVSSIGRRSDCHNKNMPPIKKARSASQTPAAGERCPCRAKVTPIKDIEYKTKTKRMVSTTPLDSPPFFEEKPRGIPTIAKTMQA